MLPGWSLGRSKLQYTAAIVEQRRYDVYDFERLRSLGQWAIGSAV